MTRAVSQAEISRAVKARPHSPETLAERWDCSAETVRQLCHKGVLRHFRVSNQPARQGADISSTALVLLDPDSRFCQDGGAVSGSVNQSA